MTIEYLRRTKYSITQECHSACSKSDSKLALVGCSKFFFTSKTMPLLCAVGRRRNKNKKNRISLRAWSSMVEHAIKIYLQLFPFVLHFLFYLPHESLQRCSALRKRHVDDRNAIMESMCAAAPRRKSNLINLNVRLSPTSPTAREWAPS